MNRVQHILSGKTAAILTTVLAIIAINSWQMILSNIDNDLSFIMAAANNLSEGHGYSIKMASLQDLSDSSYIFLNQWPPGYSWLLVITHRLSGTDWMHTAYLLNAFALTALVLIFRKLLYQLDFPAWVISVSVLYFGFILHDFLFEFADMMGTLFYLAGFSLLLFYVKSASRPAGIVLLAALCFSFCAYLKYLYLAIAAVPFLSLFWYGYKLRIKEFRQMAIAGFLMVLVLLGGLLVYLYSRSGQALYFNPTKTGFFPEQLLRLGPMILTSFINLNFYSMQVTLHSRLRYQDMTHFWSVLNWGCVIWLTYIGFTLIRRKGFVRKDYRAYYALQAFLVSACLILFLAALTVRMNEYYSLRTPSWVYFEETRYYAVFSILVFQFVIYLWVNGKPFFGKTGLLIFRLLFCLILTGEVLHGGYFLFKKVVKEKKYGTARDLERIDLKALALTRQALDENQRVVVCTNSPEIANICGLAGVATVQDISLLPESIPTSKPLLLITVIDIRVPYLFPPYFRKNETKLAFATPDVFYYTSRISKTMGN